MIFGPIWLPRARSELALIFGKVFWKASTTAAVTGP